MTARAILDASAAVHLVLNGEHAAALAAALESAALVTAPQLFCSEVGNALWKYVQAGRLTTDAAIDSLEQCLGLTDSLVAESALVAEAVVAAARHQHPVYDMMYAVLARRSGAVVITMDGVFAGMLRQMEIASYFPPLDT